MTTHSHIALLGTGLLGSGMARHFLKAGAPITVWNRTAAKARTLEAEGRSDRVLVAMDQGEGEKTIPVFGLFPDGTGLVDAYSGATATVTEGSVTLTTGSDLVLLSRPSPSAAPAGP